jgi:cytochrome c-type biogenesis protein CcmE
MTPARKKRLAIVGGILLGVAAATVIATQAFEDNLLYFYDPSQIVAGEAPTGKKFRIGGLVQPGSLERTPGSLEVRFLVTDNAHTMKVSYSGLLPDLFREGQGVIAHGRLQDGMFVADEVLAKHDENYMPPEVAKSLKDGPHTTQSVEAAAAQGAGGAT